jgi:hypothetical protein
MTRYAAKLSHETPCQPILCPAFISNSSNSQEVAAATVYAHVCLLMFGLAEGRRGRPGKDRGGDPGARAVETGGRGCMLLADFIYAADGLFVSLFADTSMAADG